MIIIEGPDNSGKTTLGQKLAKDLGMPLVHSIKPKPEWSELEALEQSIMQLLPQRIIRDRTYAISEFVYGPICREKSALGELHSQALTNLCHYNHLIIYCRPPNDVILKNDGREQMEGVLENHERLIERYDQLILELGQNIKVVRFNYTDAISYQLVLNACRDHVRKVDFIFQSAAYLRGL